MTGKHNPRSQDQDENSYAALPGTAETEFVPHNMTVFKSYLTPDREVAGCHASRWIYELINNDFTVCNMFDRARSAKLDSTYTWDHPHRLVINGKQSFGMSTIRMLSSICLDCHFHFFFRISWVGTHSDSLCRPSQAQWPLRDNQFPWHHLVWAGAASDREVTLGHSKYYPILAREHFTCCAPPCTFQVTLEVSEPRMPTWWVQLLLDRDAIYGRLKAAREQDPSRFEGATDDWVHQAPLNLNTYLKNLLESGPEDVRSISKRNKRFAVLFGPPCFPIFRQLEFAEEVLDNDGVDEGSFTPTPPPPALGPSGSTEMQTYRAYLEDVRAEVQCLIHKAGQATERPTFCAPLLHFDLQCREVPNVGASALVNADRYRILGILPNQSREVVVNAYKRQWELIPSRRRALVESLMGVAHDSGDEMLSEYAITQSSVFESQPQQQSTNDDEGTVSQALGFLGLRPPNNYSAKSIVQAFRLKLARDPGAAVTARSMLLLIAQASTDDSYQAALLMESDAKMSLYTARAVLGLDADIPWQTAADAAQSKSLLLTFYKLQGSKGIEETELYLDALDALADHTNSPTLKQAALELRQSTGLMQLGGGQSRSAAVSKTVNLALPVGLYNIGNTCYLNSLLQYLFTVKPIRDIVLNYDNSRLEMTDKSIRARLLGGNKMQMDRGEAVVAQAFARELATLFHNLGSSNQAATRPSQRLANAVLLSTHTLLHSSKQPSEQPAAPQPPPLPARPSPALQTNPPADVDMVARSVASVSESMDAASNSSSRTLVDQEDARSDHSYEEMQTAVIEQGAYQTDSTSDIEHIEDSKMIDCEQAAGSSAQAEASRKGQEVGTAAEQSVGDVAMDDAVEPETVDQKVLNALEHQKRSSGTDQQDVEEVMGSIINRLQAAIRPSSIDEQSGIQMEKIMETFFVTTVNYTKKFDEESYQHEISFDRSITAFPAPDGPCSLYDALGRNFDQQILEESKLSRYTAIKTLPPVLHVLIQRSQSMGSKNGNPVIIPEILYLDRYMDAPHDSPVFRRRVEDWAITNRISDLKSLLASTDPDPPYLEYLDRYINTIKGSEGSAGPGGGEETPIDIGMAGETWDFDGPVEEDFVLVTPAHSNSNPQHASKQNKKRIDVRGTHVAIRQMMDKELQQRETTLRQHQESMKSIPYRLHAVICHRGHMMSGHYWVWICDFEDRVWRWYNDADVRESRDTAEVLHALSTSGEPYFLCYVRDEDKEEFVNVPKRQPPPTPSEEQQTPSSRPVTADADGDVNSMDTEQPTSGDRDSGDGAPCPKYRIE